ncbi:MAG: sodium:solute symporter, partial [Clostridia bacterium]|nr:sodium:solute symporter [Clostridia bacterium]
LYWKRTTKISCWASILFSSIFMTVDMLSNLGVISVKLGLLQSPINAGAFCMLASLVLVPLVSILTKAPDKARVEEAFSCYDKVVTVRQREALADEK